MPGLRDLPVELLSKVFEAVFHARDVNIDVHCGVHPIKYYFSQKVDIAALGICKELQPVSRRAFEETFWIQAIWHEYPARAGQIRPWGSGAPTGISHTLLARITHLSLYHSYPTQEWPRIAAIASAQMTNLVSIELEVRHWAFARSPIFAIAEGARQINNLSAQALDWDRVFAGQQLMERSQHTYRMSGWEILALVRDSVRKIIRCSSVWENGCIATEYYATTHSGFELELKSLEYRELCNGVWHTRDRMDFK